MTIEEAREEKQKAEAKFLAILDDFHAKTGLKVRYIHITYKDSTKLCVGGKEEDFNFIESVDFDAKL